MKSNRLGIGARLIAKVGGRQIVRELFPANSYRSQAPASVHFGLGDADSVESNSIRWPSGRVQELKNLPADRHLLIREGNPLPVIITPASRCHFSGEFSLNVAASAGKVMVPMRFLPVILALLWLGACSRDKKPEPVPAAPAPVTMPSVAKASQIAPGPDGLARFKPTRELFTGVLKTTHQNGAPRAEIHFKEGKRHGLFTELYPDGTLKRESNWVDDKQEGQHREFHQNGKKSGEIIFKAGLPDGEQRQWYPNGQLMAVMTFKAGTPEGVRREWDEKGVTEHEVRFEKGQPVSRELVANTSLTLDEKERKYLWDAEHHGTLLRKFGLGPLVDALKARDAKGIAGHLAADFKGLVPTDGKGVEHRVLEVIQASRWDLKDGQRKALDRDGFIGWLKEMMGEFGKDPQAKIALMEFAPVTRFELDKVWRGNVEVRFWGETEPGKPFEVVVYLDVTTSQPTEDGLVAGDWLKSAEVTRLKVSRAERFLMKDVAADRGINVRELKDNWLEDPEKASPNTGGVFVCDFNHDGVSDFLLTDASLPRGYKLYRGDAKGKFTDVGDALGFNPRHAFIGSWMDLDGDGWEDLLLNTGQIFRNLKGEKFEEVTRQSNLMVVGNLLQTGAFTYHAVADFDGDGRLDIYLFRVDSQPLNGTWIDGKVGHNAQNQLLRNKGNWQFEDVTKKTKTDGGARSTFSSVWLDANNDNRPDLYVIHEYGNGLLLINKPDGTFEQRELADRAADFGSMGLASGDFDNDGNIDLYVASMYSKSGNRVIGNLKPDAYKPEVMAKLKRMVAGSQLYQNLGGLKFEPVAKKFDIYGIGWAYAPTLADLDNDGFLDLHATTGFMSRTRDKPDG